MGVRNVLAPACRQENRTRSDEEEQGGGNSEMASRQNRPNRQRSTDTVKNESEGRMDKKVKKGKDGEGQKSAGGSARNVALVK